MAGRNDAKRNLEKYIRGVTGMAMNKNPKRNASGYLDYTAFYAIRAADRETATKKKKVHQEKYPRVYICSPFRGDTENNVKNAIRYARFALEQKRFPIAPHLYFPRFMDDDKPAERELAMSFDLRLLNGCREIWVFGGHISTGMAEEIAAAKRKKIKIKYFNENGGKINERKYE